MLEYRYDTQLLIAGKNLNEDDIFEYITLNFEGDSLLAVGDDELIKIIKEECNKLNIQLH